MRNAGTLPPKKKKEKKEQVFKNFSLKKKKRLMRHLIKSAKQLTT